MDGAQRAPNRSLGASDDPFDDSYGAVPGSTDAPGPPHQTDMMSSHTWRGQNQPPVGVRAQQLLNWIRDEDVDRRRDFPREWREASAWVDDQLKDGGIRDETRRLLVAARDALGTHDQFEGYHYRRFANLQVFDPETLPKYKPRLNYREQHPIQLGSWTPGDRMFNALAQPRRDQPRPWTPVNEMWKSTDEISSYDGEQPDPRLLLYLQKLADHETTLWARAPGNVRPAEGNNLAWRESNTHETCVNFDNAGLHGWVFTDPESGDKFVWDRTGLANDEEGFAVERGARRAGIQAALRQYSGGENRRIAAANGGLLVLPADEADVPDPEVVKRQAGIGNGRPLEIPALAANQMQATDGKMDPQGFISNMAQFWRKTRQNMNEARALYMAQNGPARGPTAGLTSYLSSKPLPPRSIFGPYVWTGVEPKRQFEQDTLRHMRGLRRLFERELLLAPRPFLADLDNYYQQGLQRRRPPGLLEQNRDRDLYPNTETPRILDQIELEWVRFLLNQSMTPGMAEDLEPRTTFFIHFAERLDRIFTDTSDTLFPTTDTSVTIEDLISHMANMKGPVEKIVFYPYDVKLWLERLDALGRCRYTDDWRAYGRVQRPILTHHPESLIIWENRTDVQVDFENHPEDMVYAPRFTDRRAWDDIVGGEPQVDESVRQYFRCLAYRWGRATDILNRQETGAWLTDAPLPFTSMQTTLDEFETHFRRIAGWDGRATATPRSSLSDSTDSPLVQVVQRTLNRPWPPQAAAAAAADASPTTTHQALETIRRGIIDELVRADGLLFPGRSEDHTDPTAPRGRESVWDWAGPAVRGDLKRFFGLDRWPLQLQSEEARRRIASDVDMDAQQVWDAYLEDPTPWTYYRPKARPYAEDRVKFRSGHRIFPIGDSARQKEVVKNQVIAMVGQGKPYSSP